MSSIPKFYLTGVDLEFRSAWKQSNPSILIGFVIALIDGELSHWNTLLKSESRLNRTVASLDLDILEN